jgi:hypothetical protein
LDWTPHHLENDLHLHTVEVIGSRLVALGSTCGGAGSISWSKDGRRWTAHGLELNAYDIAAVDAGTVLVSGWNSDLETCTGGGLNAGLWVSTDLATWVPVSADLGCGWILGVVGGPRGFVGLGLSENRAAIDEEAAWVSKDGREWEGPFVVPLRFTPPHLAVAPDGTFIAFGDGIWESSDGRAWAMSADTGAIRVSSYAAGVAIGCNEESCRVWIVED